MRTIHHTIELENAEQIVRLRNITDIHLGNTHCNKNRLKQVIDGIRANEHYYWFGGGDYAEFINYKDRRFNANELDKRLHGRDDIIGEEVAMLGDYISPIASKCLAYVEGNHEVTSSRYLGRDIVGQITEAANLDKNRFLGFRGFIVLHLKLYDKVRYTLTFFLTHGTGSSRLPSGHVLYLSRFFQNHSADIVMAGHRHICMVMENPRIVPRGSGSELRTQYAMLCGSFLEPVDKEIAGNYSDYAEYVPSVPGGYEIIINPAKRAVSVERTYI